MFGGRGIIMAVEHGREMTAQRLLEEGANIQVMKDISRRNPLSLAAANGHQALVKLVLVNDGFDVNAKDYYDVTPLSQAVWMGTKRWLSCC